MGFSMSGSTTSIHRSLTKSVPEFASLGWDPYMKRWNFAYERERTLLLPLIIMLDTCKSVFSRTTSQAHVSVPSLCFWEQSCVSRFFPSQFWQSQHLLSGIFYFPQFTYFTQITSVCKSATKGASQVAQR